MTTARQFVASTGTGPSLRAAMGGHTSLRAAIGQWSAPDNPRAAINAKWAEHGGANGAYGPPVSDTLMVDRQGGHLVKFQNGLIYWWPDIGAIELREVVVRYCGMICFGETDGPGSDEPYVIVSCVSPSGARTLDPIRYEDVDAGAVLRGPIVEVFRGVPDAGLVITATVMEHDEGDPNRYRALVEAGVQSAAAAGAAALTAATAGVGALAAPIIQAAVPVVIDAINSVLGTADDLIGSGSIPVTARQLCTLPVQGFATERGLQFHVANSVPISGLGGSYKCYFDIEHRFPG